MGLIESSKIYSGRELETIFFRPVFSGPAADKLGIRVIYNMPMPTTVHLWSPAGNVLKPYQAGWQGGNASVKEQKTIDMKKVKAETAFGASDYFSMVFEQITNRSDVNMEDLSGTVLEEAETALFKASIAESLRLTMWVGNTAASGGYNTFDGILKSAIHAAKNNDGTGLYEIPSDITPENVVGVLDKVWDNAGITLKSLKADGELAFFVTTDICEAYERYLDAKGVDSAYRDSTEGRQSLCYHGIPLVDMGLGAVLDSTSMPPVICMLSDRRNLVLAVNTSDYPETEVRMWYNPDAMENRQRAVFLAGADIIDPDLVSMAYQE
ncbi:MAG: hypothetical protein J6K28_05295 [Alistipes sp.]|nr:hypothetical protein [Alistipes sp.]